MKLLWLLLRMRYLAVPTILLENFFTLVYSLMLWAVAFQYYRFLDLCKSFSFYFCFFLLLLKLLQEKDMEKLLVAMSNMYNTIFSLKPPSEIILETNADKVQNSFLSSCDDAIYSFPDFFIVLVNLCHYIEVYIRFLKFKYILHISLIYCLQILALI